MESKHSITQVLLAVLATGIMIFCGMVIETSMNIVFPTLMQEFNINTTTVQWMTTSYLLVVSIIVPISTYLKDQYRTKSLFVFALIFFICGVSIDAFANNFLLLLLGRIIQGIGTGVALPLMFNIIIDEVPAEKMGIMMAVGTLVTAIGPALGPTLGGIINSTLNWHYIFIFLLPLLVISFILGIFTIPQSKPLNKKPFDILGFIFIPIMFVGFILALSQISTNGLISWQFGITLLVGIIGLVGFIWRNLNQSHPILNVRIFNNRIFSNHVISFLLIQMTLLGLGFLLPNLGQLVLKQSSLIAALQLLLGAIIGAIFTLLSGRLLDSLGASKPIKVGTLIIFMSLLLFSINNNRLNTTLIVIFYALFMLGVGTALSNIMTNGINSLHNHEQADGNATFNVTQQFAGAVGTTLSSTIVALFQTGTTGSQKYISSTQFGTGVAFIALMILTFISCFVMWYTLSRTVKKDLSASDKIV